MSNTRRILFVLMCSLPGCVGSVDDALKDLRPRPHSTVIGTGPHSVVRADSLYRIIANGRYGFVDFNGDVVIKPRFRNVGAFVGGLAPAREGGRFGYIDKRGNWAIAPRYDYATDYSEGFAAGFIQGRAFIIDRQGAVIHEGNYDDVDSFRDGLAIVHNGLEDGLINSAGQLLVPLRHARIFVLSPLAILYEDTNDVVTPGYAYSTSTWRLIDQHGSQLGVFSGYVNALNTYGSSVFLLERKHKGGDAEYYDVFSTRGRKVGRIGDRQLDWADHVLLSGAVIGTVLEGRGGFSYSSSQLLNSSLRPVNLDSSFDALIPFGNSLLVAHNTNTDAIAVFDTKDSLRELPAIKSLAFEPATQDERRSNNSSIYDYEDDHAVIETRLGWRVLDQDGRLSSPHDIDHESSVIFIDSTQFIAVEYDTIEYDYEVLFFDWQGRFEAVSRLDSVEHIISIRNGVISAMIADRLVLVDLTGRRIWTSEHKPFYKVSTTEFEYRPHVGRYVNRDSLQTLSAHSLSRALEQNHIAPLPGNTHPIQVFAFPNSSTDKKTFEVVVANFSGDTIAFETVCSNLFLYMEVRANHQSPWTPIERQHRQDCCCGYYPITLPGRSMWKFEVPRYTGEDLVDCRLKLSLGSDTTSPRSNKTMRQPIAYSNTFKLRINPAQMWRDKYEIALGLQFPY